MENISTRGYISNAEDRLDQIKSGSNYRPALSIISQKL